MQSLLQLWPAGGLVHTLSRPLNATEATSDAVTAHHTPAWEGLGFPLPPVCLHNTSVGEAEGGRSLGGVQGSNSSPWIPPTGYPWWEMVLGFHLPDEVCGRELGGKDKPQNKYGPI